MKLRWRRRRADDEKDDHDLLLEEAHRRRLSVRRLLTAVLRRDADDSPAVAALLAQARVEAAADIGSEAVRQLVRGGFGPEAGYADARAKRIQSLIELDIKRLRRPPK